MAETLSMPTPKTEAPTKERMVKVKLLYDVWIEGIDPKTGEKGIIRVKTNTPVLDEDGNIKVDPKSKAPILIQEIVELPVSVAQRLVDLDKAKRIDAL
jgi:hypothetical protein